MLRVENLHFGYNGKPVLHDISFSVAPGELCALFGPNGSGKTTIFKCCLNLLKGYSGRIDLDGKCTRTLSVAERARRMAYVPQEHKPPFPYLAEEIVLMGRTPHLDGFFGISAKDRKKAKDALRLLGIANLARAPYNQLSGGQRQMVLIARAIAQETRIMLLDEPTSTLDFKNQMTIWQTIRKMADRGIAILACSHDPNHVSWFCDQVVVLANERLVAVGPPDQTITEPVLDTIYADACAVRVVDGVRMVLPRDLVNG